MEMENIYRNISSIVPGSLRSLTSHLEERESPILNFLYERFPNTRPAFADARAKLASAKTTRPVAPVSWRGQAAGDASLAVGPFVTHACWRRCASNQDAPCPVQTSR